jgi:hypothetical protein
MSKINEIIKIIQKINKLFWIKKTKEAVHKHSEAKVIWFGEIFNLEKKIDNGKDKTERKKITKLFLDSGVKYSLLSFIFYLFKFI